MATMEHVRDAGFEESEGIRGFYTFPALEGARECRYQGKQYFAWGVLDKNAVMRPESVLVTPEPRMNGLRVEYAPLEEVQFISIGSALKTA